MVLVDRICMSDIIKYSVGSDFRHTMNYLKAIKERIFLKRLLSEYAPKIVDALKAGTPVRTGETANSWYYEISENFSSITVEFRNSRMADDGRTPVALLIQLGHGTGTGGYVPPNDYINPIVKSLFESLESDIEKAVKSL